MQLSAFDALLTKNLLWQNFQDFEMVFSRRAVLASVSLLAMSSTSLVFAGGGVTGGATEFTQIANNVQLLQSYAKQVQQYVTQALQYEAQLRNLIKNPFSIFGGEASTLAKDVGKLMDAGMSIGGSLTKLNDRLHTKYANPLTRTFSENFRAWGNSTQDTLTSAMKSAGLAREQFESSAVAMSALHAKAKAAGGAVEALGVVAEINMEQVKSLQMLGNLIATEQIAVGDYMKQELAKESEKQRHIDLLATPLKSPIPNIETQSNRSKLKSVLF